MLVSAVVCSFAWLAWFLFGGVQLREVTTSARLELAGTSVALQVPVSGRITRTSMALGARVAKGDVLLELDAKSLELELASTEAKQRALREKIPLLRAESALLERTIAHSEEAAHVAFDQANARAREQRERAALSRTEADKLVGLGDAGAVGEMELLRSLAEASSRASAAEASELEGSRAKLLQRRSRDDLELERGRVVRQLKELEGALVELDVSVERTKYELSRRIIRAPASGRLGDLVPLREGGVVGEGTRVGSIVVDGAPVIVGRMVAATSIGRVAAGQRARIRFAGFPWTEFGMVRGTVSAIASDPSARGARVEVLVETAGVRVPLQHGLEATVEVDVEEVTPAQLVLRTIGHGMSPATPPPPPEPTAPLALPAPQDGTEPR
jgi:membrane fusion protein (multidrug efflux system)